MIDIQEWRNTRVSGTPDDPKIKALMELHDWELHGDATKIVHFYGLIDCFGFIEERVISGETKFAYLFVHPGDVYAPTLAAAEVELVQWINGENGHG